MIYISNANIDNEDMSDITDWTDIDQGNGVSTQVTFDGKSCMKLDSGTPASGSNSGFRFQNLGAYGTRVVFSFSAYFESLGTVLGPNYNDDFNLEVYNGTTHFWSRFGTDGLFIYDGTTHNEIGTDLVVLDVWQEWTFDINWTAQTVDVYLDKVLIASGVDCSHASSSYSGWTWFRQRGDNLSNNITYIDWFKAGSNFDTDIKSYNNVLQANLKQVAGTVIGSIKKIIGVA